MKDLNTVFRLTKQTVAGLRISSAKQQTCTLAYLEVCILHFAHKIMFYYKHNFNVQF